MELSNKDKQLLFWASFLSLAAAGFGFVFRVMLPDVWTDQFQITNEQAGAIAGMALWPIAVTMILFSLLVDKIGYKVSMYFAFIFQFLSVVLTMMADDIGTLKWACFCAGLGHGVVEAVINPLCATMYRDDKSKMLNILHAAWPAGIVVGGIIYLTIGESVGSWNNVFIFMMIPVVIYAVMFTMVKAYPVDERVEANVSMKDMLKEFGGLSAFLAITFLSFELMNQYYGIFGGDKPESLLLYCAIFGVIGGIVTGFLVGGVGKFMFFALCVIMIPLATAELATDHWIKVLMTPSMGAYAGWAIVASSFIMMFLRFFAGIPLKFLSPPALLMVSSLFSIAGLFLLSGAEATAAIFAAFTLYGIGQTFYWPTVLGLVSERFPKGGAMTLNTVSAMGLLTVGIFGFPFLGAVKDNFDARTVEQEAPKVFEKHKGNANFFFWKFENVNTAKLFADEAIPQEKKDDLKAKVDVSARSTLKVAAALPAIMAVCFGLMILWFKANGGYKPIILNESSDDDKQA